MSAPTPNEIRSARIAAGLSQEGAAMLVGLSGRAKWYAYESARAAIAPAAWELFLLKTGQHPDASMVLKLASKLPIDTP